MKVAGASPEGWHSIDAKFRCDWEYLARNIRGIEPTGQTETPAALANGLLFHAARARWFTLNFATGDSVWESILGAIREEAAIQKLPIAVEHEQNILRLMTQYMDHWKNQPKPTVIGAEYPIGPAEVAPGLTRTARLDDVSKYVEGANELFIGEAKTTSGTISQLVDEYEINGQTMLQVLLWDLAAEGRSKYGSIRGVMLDAVGKPGRKRDGLEFARIPVYITDFQLAWFRESLITHLEEAKAIREKGWDAKADRNPKSCLREVSGAYVVKCPYWELCKFGRSASGNYQMSNGSSLLDHKLEPGKEKMPWE